jgi:hypothetical protein
VLKAGATALTLVAALFSAHYVSSHVKSSSAPLHPSVVHIAPGVRSANVEPVTTTYAS